MGLSVKKACAGYYEVSNTHDGDAGYVVTVERRDELLGSDKWTARANWDRYFYSDPMATKREAVRCAERMIESQIQDDARRAIEQCQKLTAFVETHELS